MRGARTLPVGDPVFRLEREQWIPSPQEQVFRFFARAENLESITPAWLKFRILAQSTPEIAHGTMISYRLQWRLFPIRWRTEIVAWDSPHCFVDVQVSGPYRLWRHEHRFEARDAGTLMRDTVQYQLPFGWLGRFVHRHRVRRDLERIFDFRAERIRWLFSKPDDASIPLRG